MANTSVHGGKTSFPSYITDCVVLSNGINMPIFGLGTSHQGGFSHSAVVYALKECGYRHIDTAQRYGSENKLPSAIEESGIPRSQIFLTTKLWPYNYGYTAAKQAFYESLQKLETDYLDLFLLHWPDCPPSCDDKRKMIAETWRALEELYNQGLCKAIGVSNFLIPHLKELLQDCTVVPHVNQVEFHPYNNPKELRDYCKTKNIEFTGYCPLAKGKILDRSPDLQDIAKKYSKTVPQILIRWSLQNGVVTIPKSTKENRIKENSEVFDFSLTPKEMHVLSTLHDGTHASWDPKCLDAYSHVLKSL